MSTPFANAVRIAKEIGDRIRQALGPDDPDLPELVATETEDLQDYIARMLRRSKVVEAQAKGLKDYIEQLEARHKRMTVEAKSLKSAALWGLQEAGLPGLKRPDMTVTIKTAAPALIVEDLSKVPPEYLRHPEPEVQNAIVKSILLAGNEVPGCKLGNGTQFLDVRI